MTVRDRYDVGDKKQQAQTQRAGYVRELVQNTSALHTIDRATAMVRAGIAGAFEVELVAAWHEQRREEGW